MKSIQYYTGPAVQKMAHILEVKPSRDSRLAANVVMRSLWNYTREQETGTVGFFVQMIYSILMEQGSDPVTLESDKFMECVEIAKDARERFNTDAKAEREARVFRARRLAMENLAESKGFSTGRQDEDGTLFMTKIIGHSRRYIEISPEGHVNGKSGTEARQEINALANWNPGELDMKSGGEFPIKSES